MDPAAAEAHVRNQLERLHPERNEQANERLEAVRGVVIVAKQHALLRQNRPHVQFGCHLMHGPANLPFVVAKSPADRVWATTAWEQSTVSVIGAESRKGDQVVGQLPEKAHRDDQVGSQRREHRSPALRVIGDEDIDARAGRSDNLLIVVASPPLRSRRGDDTHQSMARLLQESIDGVNHKASRIGKEDHAPGFGVTARHAIAPLRSARTGKPSMVLGARRVKRVRGVAGRPTL
jgi:hypothetical protein